MSRFSELKAIGTGLVTVFQLPDHQGSSAIDPRGRTSGSDWRGRKTMASAPCPRCDTQIDETASTCPACGMMLSRNWSEEHRKARYRAKTRRVLAVGGLVGVVVIVVAAALRPSPTKQPSFPEPVTASLENSGPSVALPNRCSPEQHKDWISECDRALVWSSVLFPAEGEPHRLTLEVDALGNVRLLSLTPRDYYLKFYTRAPQTYGRLNGQIFVPDPQFWRHTDRGLTVRFEPQGRVIRFRYNADRHWETTDPDTIDLIKEGTSIEFQARDKAIRLSLSGATAAIEALSEPVDGSPEPTPRQILSLIARTFDNNKFNVTNGDLSYLPNPKGAGIFVYIAETNYYGVERNFLWFANAGKIVKLNGATHALSPYLQWPIEAPVEIWDRTGLSSETVLKVGLALAY